ncbi:MurR/RpiR family transcriptional regulator [Clostridium paraputrificum]|uniref:MurR/RpiR family transcriptional regulator n=1 Tax=Clostridium TaxID=1485 RepID=UPI003D32BEE7
MSCVYKIKEGMGSFTETEEKLANYILENRQDVIMLSAQELAERVSTSAAAVVRFSKKVGFKGFTALKVELAKDGDDEVEDFNTIIKENDSIGTMVKKSEAINMKAMEQTYKLINNDILQRAIDQLNGCKNVYLFGVGASGLVAQDFQYKLSRIKRMAIYQQDAHIQLASAVHIGPEDIAIGISYSGETREVNLALKKAKEAGAKTIGITKFNNNSLSKIVDYPLYIPSEEKEIRIGAITSRMTALLIMDLLYLGIAKNDVDKTEEYILKTREIVKTFK